MAESAEFRLSFEAAGDTQAEEVERVAERARAALKNADGVDSVRHGRTTAPEGTKVGEALLLAELLIAVAPGAVAGIMGVMRDLITRPGMPDVDMEIEVGSSKLKARFNSRRTSTQEMAEFFKEVGADLRR